MKFWILSSLSIVSLLILSGCGGGTPTPAEKAKIDRTLPKVSLTKHGVIVGMKSVAFEWHDMKDQRVKGIYIYKEEPATKTAPATLSYYTTLKTRFKTHFVDNRVEPNSKYTYKFRVFSDDAEGLDSQSVVIKTLPVLESVSWIHSITGLPRLAKIIWRPHTNERVKEYLIERQTVDDGIWEEIDRVEGRLSAEYIDEGLDDNHVYKYRVRVVTYDGILSTPSDIVKIITKPLPKSISNIKATKTLSRKIDIEWSASSRKDFSHYNLYRSSDIEDGYEVIAELTKTSYVDKIDEDGKNYFYRVSAVDKDGLESPFEENSIHGMTLPKPQAPAIVNTKLLGTTIAVDWSRTDPRSVSYIVLRKHKQGWFDEKVKEFKDIKSTRFLDRNVEPDSTYTYTVFSVDKHGIKSEPSIEVQVVTPESKELMNRPIQKAVIEEVSSVDKTTIEVPKEAVIAPSENLDLSGL